MSNVYKRNRKQNSKEHIALARKLRQEVTRLMKDESVCPKRSTFYIGQPCAHSARNVVAHLMRAEEFYPASVHGVIWRKHYLSQAIAECNMLEQDLQLLKEINEGLPVDKFREAARLISELRPMLKAKRKGVRKTKQGGEPTAFDRFMIRLAEFFNGEVFDDASEL